MLNKSSRPGVVLFEAEGLTYQAIWKYGTWAMAAIDGVEVLELRTVVSPADATPGTLLRAWWKEQKQAGTFQAPPPSASYEDH